MEAKEMTDEKLAQHVTRILLNYRRLGYPSDARILREAARRLRRRGLLKKQEVENA
jgi:hypothetical protein